MSKVKIGFSGLTIPQKIERARDIVIRMTGNANFVTPNPTLAVMTLAINALETAALAASHGGTNLTAAMHVKEKDVDAKIDTLAAYVQEASGGDETKILSSGFDVRKTRTPASVPAQVIDLTGSFGDFPGQVKLHCKVVTGADGYVRQVSYDGGNTWSPSVNSSKTRMVVDGLSSGSNYWFRVAAFNRKGDGPFSDPIMQRAA